MSPLPPPAPARPRPWLRAAAGAGVLAALALVFLAYRNPHTMVELANRVWACF